MFDQSLPPLTGSQLRTIRTSHGRSLDQVAADTGISKSHLSSSERTERPSARVVNGYQSVFGPLPTNGALPLPVPAAKSSPADAASIADPAVAAVALFDAVQRAHRAAFATAAQTASQPPPVPEESAAQNPLWPGVIIGFHEVLRRATYLVHSAAETKHTPIGAHIALTFPPAPDELHDFAPLLVALRQAVSNYWGVTIVSDTSGWDAASRLRWLHDLLPLAVTGPGRFTAYEPPGFANLGSGLLTVDGHGTFLFLEIESRAGDRAIYLRDGDRGLLDTRHKADPTLDHGSIATEYQQAKISQAWWQHVDRRLKRGNHPPILQSYEFLHADPNRQSSVAVPRKLLDYDKELTRAEEEGSGRLLVKNGFSRRLTPRAVDAARAVRIAAERGDDWKRFALDLTDQRAARFAQFLESLKRHVPFRDLIGKPGIEALVRTGRLADDDWLGEPLTDGEVVQVLTNVIDTLDKYYPYYQIGLLDYDPGLFWTVKESGGGGTVFVKSFHDSEDGRHELDLIIRSELAAQALRARFAELWLQLPEKDTSKAGVISYLVDLRKQVTARKDAAEKQRSEAK